jgi:hypothetical protein
MNIYNISCRSECGSYFSAYLQNVTVIAENEEDAIEHAKQWMNDSRTWFIDADPKKWCIEMMQEGLQAGVIDWHEDSDY